MVRGFPYGVSQFGVMDTGFHGSWFRDSGCRVRVVEVRGYAVLGFRGSWFPVRGFMVRVSTFWIFDFRGVEVRGFVFRGFVVRGVGSWVSVEVGGSGVRYFGFGVFDVWGFSYGVLRPRVSCSGFCGLGFFRFGFGGFAVHRF